MRRLLTTKPSLKDASELIFMPRCYVQTNLSWQQPAQIKTAGIWAAIPDAEEILAADQRMQRLGYSSGCLVRLVLLRELGDPGLIRLSGDVLASERREMLSWKV